MRAIECYGTPGRAAEMKQRLERGKQWLLRNKPVILEDNIMQLVGAAAAGSSQGELRKLAQPILARQQANGAWAQREGYPVDAYATGMALWGLHEAGILSSNELAKNEQGIAWLLATQAPDGSWQVASRATSSKSISKAASRIRTTSGSRHLPPAWRRM